MSFSAYLKQKKNEIILAIIGFVIATVLIGTVLVLLQEGLKQRLLGTRIQIKSLTSASGVFPCGSTLCIRQISSYEVSATDLVRDLKVSATFPEQTTVVAANVIYTVALTGFSPSPLNTNTVELKLTHQLDAAKRAQVFVITERPFHSSDQLSAQLPDIHVEGKDKNGNIVYY
jgi:hypothetical protein